MRKLIIACLVWLIASPASAGVLARCGASDGRAFYLTPEQGWQNDPISAGDLIFTFDNDQANVIFRDATGRTFDARGDGGEVIISRADSNAGEFGIVVIYRITGVVESYNVIRLATGARRLIWTSNKPRVGPNGMLSKAGAYVADCD